MQEEGYWIETYRYKIKRVERVPDGYKKQIERRSSGTKRDNVACQAV